MASVPYQEQQRAYIPHTWLVYDHHSTKQLEFWRLRIPRSVGQGLIKWHSNRYFWVGSHRNGGKVPGSIELCYNAIWRLLSVSHSLHCSISEQGHCISQEAFVVCPNAIFLIGVPNYMSLFQVSGAKLSQLSNVLSYSSDPYPQQLCVTESSLFLPGT